MHLLCLLPCSRICVSIYNYEWNKLGYFYNFIQAVFQKWTNIQQFLQANLVFIANQNTWAFYILICEQFNFLAKYEREMKLKVLFLSLIVRDNVSFEKLNWYWMIPSVLVFWVAITEYCRWIVYKHLLLRSGGGEVQDLWPTIIFLRISKNLKLVS